jgi:hypothetical protein
MARSTIRIPTGGSGPLLAAESKTEAGQTVVRQSVEACPPRKIISASMTRPADTAVYASGDAVTTSTSAPVVMTFANVGRFNAGGGMVMAAMLLSSSNQGTKPDLELWLFNASPAPDNDNAAFTPTDAELATLQGVIEFKGVTKSYVGDATAGAGGNVMIPGTQGGTTWPGLQIPFVCGAAATSLYGLLVARNAYTPTSAEIFTVMLQIEQE